MNKLILLLCFLLCSSCAITKEKLASASPIEKSPIQINTDTVITKHYASYGAFYNREYELTIKGTGEVSFKAKSDRDDIAVNEKWNVSQNDLAVIIEGFQNIGFFQLRNEYESPGSHSPFTTIKIITDGKEKTIKRWYTGKQNLTPEESSLRNLELLINRATQTNSRIRKAFNLSLTDYPSDENIP